MFKGEGDKANGLMFSANDTIVTTERGFFTDTYPRCQRLFWLRATAEDVLAFSPHRKFPPHERKTSGTQGNRYHELRNQVFRTYSCDPAVV